MFQVGYQGATGIGYGDGDDATSTHRHAEQL